MTGLAWAVLLWCSVTFAVGYYLGRSHGSYHTAALNLEVGLLRKQRDEARLDANEKWGMVTSSDIRKLRAPMSDLPYRKAKEYVETHDDGHTLRPPTKEDTHGK